MFLASHVIKRHFGVHTESEESSSFPVTKHFLRLCLAKIRLKFADYRTPISTEETCNSEVRIIDEM